MKPTNWSSLARTGSWSEFNEANHLAFYGHDERVIATRTPRSGRAALSAIQRMKALIRKS
jgi:hypothetical protein